jgi:hypothetical protein
VLSVVLLLVRVVRVVLLVLLVLLVVLHHRAVVGGILRGGRGLRRKVRLPDSPSSYRHLLPSSTCTHVKKI